MAARIEMRKAICFTHGPRFSLHDTEVADTFALDNVTSPLVSLGKFIKAKWSSACKWVGALRWCINIRLQLGVVFEAHPFRFFFFFWGGGAQDNHLIWGSPFDTASNQPSFGCIGVTLADKVHGDPWLTWLFRNLSGPSINDT